MLSVQFGQIRECSDDFFGIERVSSLVEEFCVDKFPLSKNQSHDRVRVSIRMKYRGMSSTIFPFASRISMLNMRLRFPVALVILSLTDSSESAWGCPVVRV